MGPKRAGASPPIPGDPRRGPRVEGDPSRRVWVEGPRLHQTAVRFALQPASLHRQATAPQVPLTYPLSRPAHLPKAVPELRPVPRHGKPPTPWAAQVPDPRPRLRPLARLRNGWESLGLNPGASAPVPPEARPPPLPLRRLAQADYLRLLPALLLPPHAAKNALPLNPASPEEGYQRAPPPPRQRRPPKHPPPARELGPPRPGPTPASDAGRAQRLAVGGWAGP